jgi:simple sugar transport system permease protein
VGGATLKKASILNVFIGVFLVHALYITMPLAGKQIFASAQIGQYTADFINYGIISVALILHAWKDRKAAEAKRAGFRGNAAAGSGAEDGGSGTGAAGSAR